MKPTPLATVLARALLPWIAALWLITSALVGWYMQHELMEQVDAGLQESAERLLDLAAYDVRNHGLALHQGGPASPQAVPQHRGRDRAHPVLLYQVVNAQREVLLRSADAPESALAVPLQTGFQNTDVYRIYTLAHPQLPIWIHVGDPLEHRRTALGETVVGLLIPLLVILPLFGAVILWVSRRRLASAGSLATELKARDGNFLAPIAQQGLPTELDAIAASANHLLHRLTEALQVERALAANAAHELRTPLATLALRLREALNSRDASARQRALAAALDAVERLSRRTEKLLQWSRAESAAALAADRINLGQLAAAVVQEFWGDPDALSRLRLAIPEDTDVWVRGDFDALAIALRNLIENALRYAPSGPVDVQVDAQGRCRVRDQGPGLTPEALSRALHRHARLGASSSPARGYGLGLSIVQAVAERLGGRLDLQSPPPGASQGLVATLQLSLAEPPTHAPALMSD